MRLVDREQRDPPAVEQLERGLGAEPLGGEVEQVELPGQERGLNPCALVG